MATHIYNAGETSHAWIDGTKSATVDCYGSGHTGVNGGAGDGGKGGAFARDTVARSGDSDALQIPDQGERINCYFRNASTVMSHENGTAASSVGSVKYSGGDGGAAAGTGGGHDGGGGGGGCAGPDGDGDDGSDGVGSSGGAPGNGGGGEAGRGGNGGGLDEHGEAGVTAGGGGGGDGFGDNGGEGDREPGIGGAGRVKVVTTNGNLLVSNQPDNANSGDSQTIEVTVRHSDNTTDTAAHGDYTIEVASGSLSITGGDTVETPVSGVLTFTVNVSGSGAGTLRIYGTGGTAIGGGLDVTTDSFTISSGFLDAHGSCYSAARSSSAVGQTTPLRGRSLTAACSRGALLVYTPALGSSGVAERSTAATRSSVPADGRAVACLQLTGATRSAVIASGRSVAASQSLGLAQVPLLAYGRSLAAGSDRAVWTCLAQTRGGDVVGSFDRARWNVIAQTTGLARSAIWSRETFHVYAALHGAARDATRAQALPPLVVMPGRGLSRVASSDVTVGGANALTVGRSATSANSKTGSMARAGTQVASRSAERSTGGQMTGTASGRGSDTSATSDRERVAGLPIMRGMAHAVASSRAIQPDCVAYVAGGLSRIAGRSSLPSRTYALASGRHVAGAASSGVTLAMARAKGASAASAARSQAVRPLAFSIVSGCGFLRASAGGQMVSSASLRGREAIASATVLLSVLAATEKIVAEAEIQIN